MANGEIDRIPVNELSERYQLVRSAVYKRIKDLGIDTIKIGNRAYVNAQQIALLDEADDFIKGGGSMAEFLEMRGPQPGADIPTNTSSGLSTMPPNDMMNFMAQMMAEFASRFGAASTENPMDCYRDLEDAAKNGWKIRTSDVARLLQLDPVEVESYGNQFFDAGFMFTRAGFRSGREGAWRVSKQR